MTEPATPQASPACLAEGPSGPRDREKQTWHDKLATTVVVPESAYPVEKWSG